MHSDFLWKTASRIVLMLLLIDVFTLAFKIQPAGSVWVYDIYIMPDGTVVGTDKIQRNGDLYSFVDNINGSIMVERNSTIIDGMGFALVGSYPSSSLNGISLYYSDSPSVVTSDVTIRNLTIQSFYYGIYLPYPSSTVLYGNRIVNNHCGIVVGPALEMSISEISTDASIFGNEIAANDLGIYIIYRSNCTVHGNSIANSSIGGIWISVSDKNTIYGNNLTANAQFAVMLGGGNVGDPRYGNSSDNAIFGNNIASNHDGISMGACSNNTVYGNNIADNGGAGIDLAICSDTSLYGNYITAGTVGIELLESSDTTVSGNNIIANNNEGIRILGGSNNTACENNITNSELGIYSLQSSSSIVCGNNIKNNVYGIELGDSLNNTIYGNKIAFNEENGIDIVFSSNDTIFGNDITANLGNGISLDGVSNSRIYENDIRANQKDGIRLDMVSNSRIYENDISANEEYGISFSSSSSNTIYHNRFIENRMRQVYVYDSSANTWDDGYPSGGNYWSDYNGSDVFRGVSQNETGADGIGDTPYSINDNNIDHYPLMPWLIMPDTGGNRGKVSVRITGSGFSPGTLVKLAKLGCPDIEGTDTLVPTPNLITTAFDLRNKEPGLWDVVVRWPNGTQVTFRAAFTIVENGESKPWILISGSGRLRINDLATEFITFGNSGSVDVYDVTLLIKLQHWPDGTEVTMHGTHTPDVSGIQWAQVPQISKMNSTLVVPVWIYSIPAKSSKTISLGIWPHELGLNFGIDAEFWQPEPREFTDVGDFADATGSTVFSTLTRIYASAKEAYPDLLTMSITDFADNLSSWIESNGDQIRLIPYTHLAVAAVTDILRGAGIIETVPLDLINFLSNATSPSIQNYLGDLGGLQVSLSREPQTMETDTGFSTLDTAVAFPFKDWSRHFMTSPYGNRDNPFAPGTPQFHNGIDVTAAYGESVYSITNGVVSQVGVDVNGCYYIAIRDNEGNEWMYAHFTRNPRVALGRNVGDTIIGGLTVIGKADSTGASTGNHLHVQVWDNHGILKDPSKVVSGVFDKLMKAPAIYKGPHGGIEIGSASLSCEVVGSIDPNDKEGPSGFGSQRFIALDRVLTYVIFFENLENATASAENVVITDQLDSSLDWSTLTMGEMSHPQNVTVYFNSTTGTITWNFTGINLPPNVNPPEGEGWVTFTISPKPYLLSGTEIRNKATVVFDVNPPIDTPEFLNTIDATPPSSNVSKLASEQPLSFYVNWSGTDETGSGIKDYTVYVSDNGGPYEEWLYQTTDQSAMFAGEKNHTYSFYCTARDNAGNTEQTHVQADTTTAIDSTPPTIRDSLQNPQGDPLPGQPVAVSVNVTDATSGTKNVTLSYTIDNGTTWTDLPMNYNSSTSLYEATIPAQPLGTIVEYKFAAYDNTENLALEDNAGRFYEYATVPEYPKATLIMLFAIFTTLAITPLRKQLQKPRKKSAAYSCPP